MNMKKKVSEKQKQLTEELIQAAKTYYTEAPLMEDPEYNAKAEELKRLEAKSGVILPNSPTIKVGADVDEDSDLPKVAHEQPALSLDKVKYKDVKDLEKWIGNQEVVVSWKMDGMTLVVTYDNGKLVSVVTRGNGEIGEDVTFNAKYIDGIPEKIEYLGHLVLRGEAVMEYKEFERLNTENPGAYQNPRNLVPGTVRSDEAKNRKISFYAFELVTPGVEEPFPEEGKGNTFNLQYHQGRILWLSALGFQIVPIGTGVTAENVDEVIGRWEEQLLEGIPYPTDGLVFTYDNLKYGWSLGRTGKFPRWAMAFKWNDETEETTITNVEWSTGKTGLITPVAEFNPVRLGAGSTITRASLHNISIMEKLGVKIGSKADVYLANMIIPQVLRCKPGESMTEIKVPTVCPVCGQPTRIEDSNGVKTLHCDNSVCAARQLGSLMNTFSREGLFVKGLGESQIEDLLEVGLVSDTLSFYTLADEDRIHGMKPGREDEFTAKVEKLLKKDGWGLKKWDNLISAINASRKTTLQKFLYSLNIPLLGNDLSKKLSKYWFNDIKEFLTFVDQAVNFGTGQSYDEIIAIEGVGPEKAENFIAWLEETTAYRERYEGFLALVDELEFPETELPLLQRFINDLGITGMTPEMAKSLSRNWSNQPNKFIAAIRETKYIEARDFRIQHFESIGIDPEVAKNFGYWMWDVADTYGDETNPVLKVISRLDELYKIIDELNITDVSAFLGTFDAVDDQGYVLEGMVGYKGKEYFCHVNYEYCLSVMQEIAENILNQLQDENPAPTTESVEGLTFVITGAVNQYKNRDEFKASVEARGGKVAGSVSKASNYLVNNDVTSTSGKNQKAKELGIPVISEDEFIRRFGK